MDTPQSLTMKPHDEASRCAAEYFGQISRWIREKPAFSDEIARLFG